MSKVVSKKKDRTSKKADNLRAIREGKATETAIVKKPKADVFVFPVLSEPERKEKAVALDAKVKELIKATFENFVDLGVAIREVKVYELYKCLKDGNGKQFKTFESWLTATAPTSRSNAFAAYKAMDKLLPIISSDELKQMPRYSIELLKKVPKLKIQSPDSPIRQAAKKSKSRKELVKTIQEHAPEAHVEEQEVVKMDEGARKKLDRAVEVMMALADIEDPGQAIEAVAAEFLTSPCQDERFPGMSWEEAYEALQKQRKTA